MKQAAVAMCVGWKVTSVSFSFQRLCQWLFSNKNACPAYRVYGWLNSLIKPCCTWDALISPAKGFINNGSSGYSDLQIVTLSAPGNNILPACATHGTNPDVLSGDVPSGSQWNLQGSLCPDPTKGPARQPPLVPPLNATPALYCRPCAITGGQNGALPVVRAT